MPDNEFFAAPAPVRGRSRQGVRPVVLPIIAPSIVGVALFGFSLPYDELARTRLAAGNILPLRSTA